MAERREGSRARRFLLVLAATILTLALCEVGLRMAWHNPYRREAPDTILKLALHHPRTDHRLDRSAIYGTGPTTALRTDDRSYILPSFQYPDPDLTIAFLGGSTTECSAVLEGRRFHALVSNLLAKRGLRVNTLNAARSGNTLHDSLNVLINHVVEDRPDVVVLMHAVNDTGLLAAGQGYRPRMGREAGLKDVARWCLQVASQNLQWAALARQALTWQPLRRTGGHAAGDSASRQEAIQEIEQFRRRLISFVRLCRTFEITPILMTEPLAPSFNALTPAWAEPRAQDTFNQAIRDVGSAEGVRVVDLVRFLQERVPGWDQPMRVFYDGMHVTEFGAERYAEQIVAVLGEELLSLRTRGALRSRPAPAPRR
jgi:lysophospholipase L1-like esterase